MAHTTSTAAPQASVAQNRKQARKAATVAALAASLEWYDFFIFGTAAALVFNKTYFDTGDPVVSAINSFATFAVAFLARPFGGIAAGHFGDKVGRKPVLVAAIVLMALATFLIGLTPDTEITWLAPAFLLVLRLAQGLALGAQWGGAMLLATEYAPANRRGFYGSFAQVGVPVGIVAGNLAFLLLSSTTDDAAFLSWAWRVPFLASLVMLAVGLYIHKHLEETPAFREAERKLQDGPRQASPVLQVLRHNGGTVLQAAGAFLVLNATFYAIVIASLQYADVVLGIERSAVLLPVLIGAILQVVLMPLAALASDVFGRTRVFGIGIAALGASAFPVWLLFSQASAGNVTPVWVAVLVTSALISISYGPQAALFAEIFPAHLRYSGASLGYQLATVLGGLTPIVMVALIGGDSGNVWRFAAYLVALALIALWCVWRLGRRAPRTTG